MKIFSVPNTQTLGNGESGIHTVIRQYEKHGAEAGIEWVYDHDDADVLALHAGMASREWFNMGKPIVAHTHGLYWTADYHMSPWAYKANKDVLFNILNSDVVTVPSDWVAETLRRDLRIDPIVLSHGIDLKEWEHDFEPEPYVVLYAKNRAGQDVCDPSFVPAFAWRFPEIKFLSTFAPENTGVPNLHITGVVPHGTMKELVQRASVYVSTTKETWGLGIAEALASGTPVVAFNVGGAKDLVQHGVNGYLAENGNFDDLAQGLIYCIEHRKVLSENSIHTMGNLGWDKVVNQAKLTYAHAMYKHQKPTTWSVVIPYHNKSEEELTRAVESVLAQTFPPSQVYIVDDASETSMQHLENHFDNVYYVRLEENKGVAYARNFGASLCESKYITFLDSDDWLDPAFAQACIDQLEQDKALAIAYTRITWHKPDGSEGLSEWPTDFSYEGQLNGRNQVPTACVIRKEIFDRSGGYRSRYCPTGAGSEDAELWLRIGALGGHAKLSSGMGLFHYSLGTGLVSGNRDYKEVNWREWHPYTQDGRHPSGSIARPARLSHPVMQYDEPVVSVVIPCGAGHEELLEDALSSLEAQSFRKWEAVVVMDNELEYHPIMKRFPYVRWFNTNGKMGAGHARNLGVSASRGQLVLFLDADDWLSPDAIEKMVMKFQTTGGAVYSDYYGIATVNDPSKLDPKLRKRIVSRDEKTKETVMYYKAIDYDYERALAQPQNPPYLWCNVTTLFPRHWHDEIGGFDESMSAWEDVLYWYKLAWMGKPFHRIEEPLLTYRFTTGTRREQGLAEWDDLMAYMRYEKHQMLS